jgi:hypothetical protein
VFWFVDSQELDEFQQFYRNGRIYVTSDAVARFSASKVSLAVAISSHVCSARVLRFRRVKGCQIFLGTTYQKWGEIYQMSMKYTK